MLSHVTAADKVVKGINGIDVCLHRFPPECLMEIIFGSLLAVPKREEITRIITNNYPKVKLYESRLSLSEYDLDIVPYRHSL